MRCTAQLLFAGVLQIPLYIVLQLFFEQQQLSLSLVNGVTELHKVSILTPYNSVIESHHYIGM